MKLLLDSYVFEEVKRDKVLSENFEDLRNTLKEASIELDSRPLSKADLKKLADLFDFIITENRDIHKISNELGISDKILLLDEALQILYVFSWLVLWLAFGDNPILSVPMLPAPS